VFNLLLDGKDVAKILGPNIKKARLKRGYTQEFLAEKINISNRFIKEY